MRVRPEQNLVCFGTFFQTGKQSPFHAVTGERRPSLGFLDRCDPNQREAKNQRIYSRVGFWKGSRASRADSKVVYLSNDHAINFTRF